MSATFGSPVAAALLAVELLLFEWKPRSFIPVALASATAALLRPQLIGAGALFAVPAHAASLSPLGVGACVLSGLLAAGLSGLLTLSVYFFEDLFEKLPIHWMWWPAIGGLVIGSGGLIYPHALGVGYDVIEELLQGKLIGSTLVLLILVKWTIWSVSLGSGTSGGVLAPLLMMGAALGGVEAQWFPDMGLGFWQVISMGAILGGTMRSPLTAIVFSLELTHDVNMMLPLLVAVTIAHGFTVLVLKRSILTEKVARRGFHLSREYAVDPLEILFVREVMRTNVVALPAGAPMETLASSLHSERARSRQRLYPVIDEEKKLAGVVTRDELQHLVTEGLGNAGAPLRSAMTRTPVVAYPDESLRVVVYRMAETGLTRFPVISRNGRQLVGMISLTDLLKARTLTLDAERRRERVLGIRIYNRVREGASA